jgi:hypothetical protein
MIYWLLVLDFKYVLSKIISLIQSKNKFIIRMDVLPISLVKLMLGAMRLVGVKLGLREFLIRRY